MAPALVQSKGAVDASGTSHAVTLDASPIQGDLLVACFRTAGLVSTVTAPAGWSAAVSDDDEAGSFSGGIWYKIAGAGESATVTFTTSGSALTVLDVFEWSQIRTSSPLDKTNTNDLVGTQTASTTGTTGTLTQANEVAMVLAVHGTGSAGHAWDSGFTTPTPTDTRSNPGYKITAATTALNPSCSWTTARSVTAMIATFKSSDIVTATFAAPLGALTATIAAIPEHPASFAASLDSLSAAFTATVEHPAAFSTSLGPLTAAIIATPQHPASLAAPLGGLSASISTTVEHPATLTADLGALTATAAATPEHPATLAAPLGALSASITAVSEHGAVLDALLGQLTAAVSAGVQEPATFTADLGALTASIAAGVEHPATFAAPLGPLTATAPFTITRQAFADAQLGGLTASISSIVERPALFAAPLGPLTGAMTIRPPRHDVLITVGQLSRRRFYDIPHRIRDTDDLVRRRSTTEITR